MSYAKLDDLYDDKRKIKRAWRAHPPNPIGVHAMAITYCQRHRLDGCVPDEWLEDVVRNARQREAIIATMVDCRLLDREPHEDGEFRIHDFLDWNESAEIRASRSKQSADAARRRWANGNGNA